MRNFLLSLCLLTGISSSARSQSASAGHNAVPDLPGYVTLQCDLHTHSAFSDGKVWPSIRTEEAIREGLDCLGITEHLEYLPHREDLPHTNRNRAYEIAREAADSTLMVINGVEITRGMPPGHSTAVFIEDANALLIEDVTEVYEAAKAQGAFIFNNHPDLFYQRSNAMAEFEPLHIDYIGKGLIQGLEIANLNTFSEEALQLAIEHDLTFIGSSDLHGTSDREFDIQQGGHRTSTLVFADDRSKASLKQALIHQRTVVWFRDQFIGREEWLHPFLMESLTLSSSGYQEGTVMLRIEIANHTASEFLLKSNSEYTFYDHTGLIRVPAQGTVTLHVKTVTPKDRISLSFEVLNALYAPGQHPVIHFEAVVD